MKDKLDFIVNYEKKTVTCIATGCEFDIFKELDRKLSSYPKNVVELIFHDLTNSNDLLLNDKFIGTARCSGDDEFDVEYGKQLAIKKMRYKYNKAKSKAMMKMREKYFSAIRLFADMNEWYDKRSYENAIIIDSYMK